MTFHPISRRATLAAMAAAVATAVTALPVRAQDDLVLLETARGITYLNGGVGREEQTYMHQVAKDWPLRMIFSERKDDEFVANVSLNVSDTRGAPVLTLDNAGPMTYARVPAGTYRVTASAGGVTESREVTLDGKQGKDVYFHWKGKPKIDPWNGRPVGGKQAAG